jgi:hypothetical protein
MAGWCERGVRPSESGGVATSFSARWVLLPDVGREKI